MGIPRNASGCKKCGKLIGSAKGGRHSARCGTVGSRGKGGVRA